MLTSPTTPAAAPPGLLGAPIAAVPAVQAVSPVVDFADLLLQGPPADPDAESVEPAADAGELVPEFSVEEDLPDEGEAFADETAFFALALGMAAPPVALFAPPPVPVPPAEALTESEDEGTAAGLLPDAPPPPAPAAAAEATAIAEEDAPDADGGDAEPPALDAGPAEARSHSTPAPLVEHSVAQPAEAEGFSLEGLEVAPAEVAPSEGLGMLAEEEPQLVIHAPSLDRLSLRVSDGPDQVLDIEVERLGEDGLEVRVVAPPEEVDELRAMERELERTLEERGLRLGRYTAQARQDGGGSGQQGAGRGAGQGGASGSGGDGEAVEPVRVRGLGRLLNVQA